MIWDQIILHVLFSVIFIAYFRVLYFVCVIFVCLRAQVWFYMQPCWRNKRRWFYILGYFSVAIYL